MLEWVRKLAMRIMALEPGWWMIVLKVGKSPEWTVTRLGKGEMP